MEKNIKKIISENLKLRRSNEKLKADTTKKDNIIWRYRVESKESQRAKAILQNEIKGRDYNRIKKIWKIVNLREKKQTKNESGEFGKENERNDGGTEKHGEGPKESQGREECSQGPAQITVSDARRQRGIERKQNGIIRTQKTENKNDKRDRE